jgi:hypothetical protein
VSRNRQRSRYPAEKGDELAPPHSKAPEPPMRLSQIKPQYNDAAHGQFVVEGEMAASRRGLP